MQLVKIDTHIAMPAAVVDELRISRADRIKACELVVHPAAVPVEGLAGKLQLNFLPGFVRTHRSLDALMELLVPRAIQALWPQLLLRCIEILRLAILDAVLRAELASSTSNVVCLYAAHGVHEPLPRGPVVGRNGRRHDDHRPTQVFRLEELGSELMRRPTR